MYKALCDFCKTDVEPLVVLKDLLSRKAQIEQYDTIYSAHVESDAEQGLTATVIPGLSYKIKLLIFAAYYRKDLYSGLKHNARLENSPEFLKYLEEQLQDERVVGDSFCEITYLTTVYRILSAIYLTKYRYISLENAFQPREFVYKPYPYPNPYQSDLMDWQRAEDRRKRLFDLEEHTRRTQSAHLFLENDEDLKLFHFEREGDLLVGGRGTFNGLYDPYGNRLDHENGETWGRKPKIDKLYFQYVLFGSAAISKFEDISDGLYLHGYMKLFSAAPLFYAKTGPHEGFYNQQPAEFFAHDVNHLREVIHGFATAKDYNDCITLYKQYRSKPHSFEFRYVCMVLFLAIFDGLLHHNVGIAELLANPDRHFDCEDDVFFPADNFYCMKWILDSMDIDPDVVSRVKPIMDASGGRLRCRKTGPQVFRHYANAFSSLANK